MSGFGAALGAVGGLTGVGTVISGLGAVAGAFSGKKSSYNERLARDKFNLAQEKIRQDQRDNGLSYLRNAAEKAGFNPLAVLNGNSPGQYQPAFASGYATSGNSGGLADGLAALSATLTDVEALKIRKAELELDKQRLEKLNKDATLKAPQGGIYARSNSNISRDSGAVRDTDDIALGDEYLDVDRGYASAEVIEERYGDLGGSLYGVIPLLADLDQTAYRFFRPKGEEVLTAEQRRLKGIKPKARPTNKKTPKNYRSQIDYPISQPRVNGKPF